MLDSETKSRIDSARDILVGKVPDPKSQVEQITIALIYKFMDDMDRQSEELGGKASFFTGDFRKYRWAQLLDKRYSGHERLALYAEGIEKMNQNKNIPQLFRDIFKGVFLPYRDPETLNLFLKEINGFSYDHSERLGDAFEYLLSVLGTQGEAGQFRTPRHIIDFIVAVVDPKKTDTILDPACGTAGFLISAYKHILKGTTESTEATKSSTVNFVPYAANSSLTPDERAGLMTNFRGYDIAPDMVRLSRANLYLHGFPNPVIHEYDTLTSEERWDERCDVILANPPFMTPKGGIRPHNRFSIKAKRSEVLFVDYMAEHLNPGGRAGIIVPEGIIFQSQNAYKALRKMLVENYLWAVVSLPSGVFNPYAGVKTSVLFLDRNLAMCTDEILFVKVENDGFDLGAQRRPIERNDLPEALRILNSHKKAQKAQEGKMALTVPRKGLLESPDINLSGDRYRTSAVRAPGKWPMVELGDEALFLVESGGTPSSSNPAYWDGNVYWATLVDLPQSDFITELSDTQRRITEKGLRESSAVLLPASSVLVSSRATIGRVAITKIPTATNQGFKNIVIKNTVKVNPRYVAYAVTQLVPKMEIMASGGTFKEISKTNFSNLEIPLPPLEEQERIVAELEGYRKVIEGARQILTSYKPTIRIDPKWPRVKLRDVATFLSGGTPPKANEAYWVGRIPWISAKDMKSDVICDASLHVSDPAIAETATQIAPIGSLLILVRGMGLANGVPVCEVATPCAFNQDVKAIRPSESLNPTFLRLIFKQDEKQFARILETAAHGTLRINTDDLREVQFPLPPLSIQRQIVAELEAERKLVEANRELITRMEAKIKAKLAEVWGEA